MSEINKKGDSQDVVSQLEKLVKLKNEGILTATEFETQKQKILNS